MRGVYDCAVGNFVYLCTHLLGMPILIGTRDTGKPCGLDEIEIVNPTEKSLNQGLNKI